MTEARGSDIFALAIFLPGDQMVVAPIGLTAARAAAFDALERAEAVIASRCAIWAARLAELDFRCLIHLDVVRGPNLFAWRSGPSGRNGDCRERQQKFWPVTAESSVHWLTST